MGHQHHRAPEGGQRRQHLVAGRRVEVVGRLVQQQHVGGAAHQPGQRQPGLLPTGEGAGQLVDAVPAEQEGAEDAAQLHVRGAGRGRAHVVQHRAVGVEGLVLLGVVAQPQPVAGVDRAGVRGLRAGEYPQQCGLAGAVEAEDDDARAAVDGEVDPGEDLQRPVGLRQSGGGQRRAPARRRVGEAQLGDPVGDAHLGQAGGQPLGPAVHLVGRAGLGRLGPHLVRLGLEGVDLLLGVGPLAAAAALVELPLGQVRLPVDVVDVQGGAGGVEVEDLVHAAVEQVDVVADHDQPAVVGAQELAQPDDRVGVEVVGGLVEQQGRLVVAGPGEQDAGQLHPAALAAGERLEPLGEHSVLQPERRADPGRLGLGRVPAERAETLLQPAVAADGRVAGGLVDQLGHFDVQLLHLAQQRVETAGGQDAITNGAGRVAAAGILREVAELTADVDLSGERQCLAGQRLQQRRLARPVASDEPDPVAGLDTERHRFDEGAGARAQLEIGRSDHWCT